MSEASSSRPWQEIAADAAREQAPEKLHKLTEELERALDEREKKRRSQPDEQARLKSA